MSAANKPRPGGWLPKMPAQPAPNMLLQQDVLTMERDQSNNVPLEHLLQIRTLPSIRSGINQSLLSVCAPRGEGAVAPVSDPAVRGTKF